jgi:hypothetical protein
MSADQNLGPINDVGGGATGPKKPPLNGII